MTAAARYVSTRKVSIAWLTALGLVAGPELPDGTPPPWATTGFITARASGGSADVQLPLAHPIVTLQCWAVDPDTGVPPWNFAHDLAEAVRAGCLSQGSERHLAIPDSDQNARILSAYLISEPRPSYGDAGDYACVTADLALHWAISA